MESGGGEGDNGFGSDFLPPAATRYLYSLLGATSLQEAFPSCKQQVSQEIIWEIKETSELDLWLLV